MTTPSVLPSKYAGNYTDYLKAPGRKDGGMFQEEVSVSIPSGSPAGTVVGLMPFQKGFKMSYGSKFNIANIGDGSFTGDFGYVYEDNVTYTNDPDAFHSAGTEGRSGGLVTFDEEEGLVWEAAANGWIAFTTGATTTDATDVLTGIVAGSYGNV